VRKINLLLKYRIIFAICTLTLWSCASIKSPEKTPYSQLQAYNIYYEEIGIDEVNERISDSISQIDKKMAPNLNDIKVKKESKVLVDNYLKDFNSTTSSIYAKHIYAKNNEIIYRGKLPPLLQAVGVVELKIDSKGKISNINWLRKPLHAPVVVSKIEKIILSSEPYPIARGNLNDTYIDTFLWDKSGTFQLRTLSEGQN
jgi:hypothetical protein